MTSNIPTSWCANSSDTYFYGITRSCSAEKQRTLAIYLDGDLNKLPDFIYTYDSISGTNITMNNALPELVAASITSSTKFLNHRDGATYNYSAAQYQTTTINTWVEFESSLITGTDFSTESDKFRTGVAYIKPIVLANFPASGTTRLSMRNITIVEVDSLGGETPINLPIATNQDVQPIFRCDGKGGLLMSTGVNNTLESTEDNYTYTGYCQDPISGAKESRVVSFEIDKTAPSAPTWDALGSGTHTTGQNIFVTPDAGHSIVFYGQAGGESIAYYPHIDGITMYSDGSNNRNYQIQYRQFDAAGNLGV